MNELKARSECVRVKLPPGDVCIPRTRPGPGPHTGIVFPLETALQGGRYVNQLKPKPRLRLPGFLLAETPKIPTDHTSDVHLGPEPSQEEDAPTQDERQSIHSAISAPSTRALTWLCIRTAREPSLTPTPR